VLSQIKPQAPSFTSFNSKAGMLRYVFTFLTFLCCCCLHSKQRRALCFLRLSRKLFIFLLPSDPVSRWLDYILSNNMSDANQIDQATALRSLKMLDVYPKEATGCKIHGKSPSTFRYAKMKAHGTGRRQEYFIHHLVVISRGEKILGGDFQVSHLCHEKRCIKQEHIIQESAETNRSRQACASATLIEVSCPCCAHTFTVNPCRHNPPCILKPLTS